VENNFIAFNDRGVHTIYQLHSHLMPPQQHLYNGLASPADYSILHMNGLTRTDSVLAYGYRA